MGLGVAGPTTYSYTCDPGQFVIGYDVRSATVYSRFPAHASHSLHSEPALCCSNCCPPAHSISAPCAVLQVSETAVGVDASGNPTYYVGGLTIQCGDPFCGTPWENVTPQPPLPPPSPMPPPPPPLPPFVEAPPPPSPPPLVYVLPPSDGVNPGYLSPFWLGPVKQAPPESTPLVCPCGSVLQVRRSAALTFVEFCALPGASNPSPPGNHLPLPSSPVQQWVVWPLPGGQLDMLAGITGICAYPDVSPFEVRACLQPYACLAFCSLAQMFGTFVELCLRPGHLLCL